MATVQIDFATVVSLARDLYGKATPARREARPEERANAPGGTVMESRAEAAVREAGDLISASLAALEPLCVRLGAEAQARCPTVLVARPALPPGVMPNGRPA